MFVLFSYFLQDKRANGETVLEITTTKLHQLPLVDFAASDFGQKKQKFGFKAGPVCFNWEWYVVNAAVFKQFFETWVQIFIGPIAMLYRIFSQNGAIKVVLNFVIFDAKSKNNEFALKWHNYIFFSRLFQVEIHLFVLFVRSHFLPVECTIYYRSSWNLVKPNACI